MNLVIDEATKNIYAQTIEPLPITSGRVLSPWHDMSLYESAERLAAGIASHDASCKAKGIADYIMVVMKAPDGFYEASVEATARAMREIKGDAGEPTQDEIAETAAKMKRLEHLIYFVPQLLPADEYMRIIQADPDLYQEVMEFADDMEGEELLASLQEYALFADPKVDRDYFEVGYPAKFRAKLLDSEGWNIEEILRRGAFARNQNLTDETVLGEIAGEAGTSGQRLKRSVVLSSRAELSQLMKDVAECLPNNPVWRGMIRDQLDDARSDFPEGTVHVSIYAPSTGILTLYFAVTQENGVLFVPTYSLSVEADGEVRRMYAGELQSSDTAPVAPEAYRHVLDEYYGGDVGSLVMTMTSGGYEVRDIDILEDLGLTYGSFRCDAEGDARHFFRMKNGRWRKAAQVVPFGQFKSYLERNSRLLQIIVRKLSPRIGPGICDGSLSERQLEDRVDAEIAGRGEVYIGPPEQCDVCTIPLSGEVFMSDGRVKDGTMWANMCADCTIYYGAGIGWGIGQLYRKAEDGRWLLVGGGPGQSEADDERA